MAREPYEVMDLKALRCFFAMARQGSLTKAGIELGISEAAVSQRVKSLETYLRVKLYEARGGRVRLTPAGERTMDLAVSVFDEMQQFEHALTSGAETAQITLAAPDSVLRYFLPDRVEAFYRAHPLAQVRLLARSVEETLRLVRTNECELGVIPEWTLPKELVFQPIATYPGCVLLPKGHPLARRGRADFSSLLDKETVSRYPLIVLEVQSEGCLLRETLERFNLPFNVRLEVGSIDTLKHYVARGLGVAAISAVGITDEDRARLEIVPVPAELNTETTYGVVMRRDKHRSSLLDSMLQVVGAGREGVRKRG